MGTRKHGNGFLFHLIPFESEIDCLVYHLYGLTDDEPVGRRSRREVKQIKIGRE